MTEQKPLTAEEMTAWKAAEWHLVGLNPAQQLRLWATLDAERAEVSRLREETVSLRMDSGNYRGACGLCCTKNMDMLTDSYCAQCEIDRLRESNKELAAALTAKWRGQAVESREESGRIRRTIKEATDAEERCLVRAEVWDNCAAELEQAALTKATEAGAAPTQPKG